MNWLYFVDPMIAYLIDQIPRQKAEKGSVEAQTSNENQAIPVVFGTRDISMNITWNGASYARAYKKKGGKK